MKKVTVDLVRNLKGHTLYNYAVEYFSETNQVVSGSWDDTIRIWDYDTGKEQKVIKDHEGDVNFIIKWSKTSFLSCGNDAKMFLYELPQGEKMKSFEMLHESICRVLKVSEDEFLACTHRSQIFLISFSKNCVLKRIGMELARKGCPVPVGYNTHMLVSKLRKNCFFISGNYSNCSIFFLNYVDCNEIQRFKAHEQDQWAMTTFIRKNEEFLISGGNRMNVYIYNTTDFSKNVNSGGCVVSRKIKGEVSVYAVFLIQNRYLLAGDGQGLSSIYRFNEENFQLDFLASKKIHNAGIFLFRCSKIAKTFFEVVSVSDDHDVNITRISSVVLRQEESMEDLDTKERISYLLEDYNAEEIDSITLKVSESSINIFKTLLYTS